MRSNLMCIKPLRQLPSPLSLAMVVGLVLCLGVFSLDLRAQIVTSRQPIGWQTTGGLRNAAELPTLRTPYFDTDSARIAMESAELVNRRAYIFAHKLYADVDIIREGKRIDTDTHTVWLYRVRSKGALSLNFLFEDFQLPEEGQLFVYSPDMKHMLGGWGEINNNPSRILPTSIISGDEVIIECQVPRGSQLPSLRLTEINHGVRSVHIKGEPRYDQTGLSQSICAPNVSCMPELLRLSQSVVVLAVNGVSMGTATLINNTSNDGTPYLISAYHVFSPQCLSPGSVSILAKTVVAFFNYASPSCSGEVRGTEEQTIAGGTLVGVEPSADAVLIKLNQKPPRDYSAYYCGWNTEENPQGQFVNIHHPRVLPKRVGISNKPLRLGTTTSGGKDCKFGEDLHWFVQGWEIGTTQPGSSGSPLFDKDHLFIGALTGGKSECSDQSAEDDFYSFAKLSRLDTEGSTAIMRALNPSVNPTQKCQGLSPEESGRRLIRTTHISGLSQQDSLYLQLSKVSREDLLNTSGGINAIGEKFVLQQETEMLGFYTVLRLDGQEVPDTPIKYAIYIKEAQAPITTGTISLTDLVTYSPPQQAHIHNKRSAASYLEVYTPLEYPIKSEQRREYIIALDIPSIPSSLRPLVQEKSKDSNTLHYRIGDKWTAASVMSKPFSSGAALWVDPILTEKEGASLDGEKVDLFSIKNTYTDNIVISINREEPSGGATSATLEVFDLSGRTLYEKAFSTPVLILPRSHFEGLGVLLFRVRRDGETASIKAYFPAR